MYVPSYVYSMADFYIIHAGIMVYLWLRTLSLFLRIDILVISGTRLCNIMNVFYAFVVFACLFTFCQSTFARF